MAEPIPGVDRVSADALGGRLADELPRGGRFVMLVGLDERSVGATAWRSRPSRSAPTARWPASARTCRSTRPPTRPSPRWCRRRTGTSARRATCSGSSPSATPIRAGSSSTSAGRAATTRCARMCRPTSGHPRRDRRFVPFEVHGEGVYQLPVGPIHAGIIEPGHFRFSAIGERVLHLDARLFFVHRGPGEARRGAHLRGRSPARRARLRRVHGHARDGVCAGRRGADRHDHPAAGPLGAGAPRRARTALQPRRRPRQHLRGDRVPARGLPPGLAQGAAAPGERRADRPPLPHGHRRPRRARRRSRRRAASARLARDPRRGRPGARRRGPRARPLGGRHVSAARDGRRDARHRRCPRRARGRRPRERARRRPAPRPPVCRV